MSFLSSLLNNLGTSKGVTKPTITLSCDGSSFQFPVNPSEFGVSVSNNNSTVNINSIGELNMLGKTGLKQMSISSFFPVQQYEFCSCIPESPENYVKKIEDWRTSGKPCRFSVSGSSLNYPVSIESFSWNVNDGTGDINFTLEMKEYRYLGTEAEQQVNEKTGLKERVNTIDKIKQNIKYYPGDSLGDVLGRAVGRADIIQSNTYTDCFRALVRGGGLRQGEVINLARGQIKRLGLHV